MIPSRSWSYRGVEQCIISTAQQASPNVMGCMDPLRTQFVRASTLDLVRILLADSSKPSQVSRCYLDMVGNERFFLQCVLQCAYRLVLTGEYHLTPLLACDAESFGPRVCIGCTQSLVSSAVDSKDGTAACKVGPCMPKPPSDKIVHGMSNCLVV